MTEYEKLKERASDSIIMGRVLLKHQQDHFDTLLEALELAYKWHETDSWRRSEDQIERDKWVDVNSRLCKAIKEAHEVTK